MITALRAGLHATAAAACLLGLWGILANLAIPLMPDFGKTEWNFFGPFEDWNPSDRPERDPDRGRPRGGRSPSSPHARTSIPCWRARSAMASTPCA